jgi:hypothetical protein
LIGYTQDVVAKNKAAVGDGPGVMLGRICIEKNVPVNVVANFFGVSRPTIYAWFCGNKSPSKDRIPEIQEFINNLKG